MMNGLDVEFEHRWFCLKYLKGPQCGPRLHIKFTYFIEPRWTVWKRKQNAADHLSELKDLSLQKLDETDEEALPAAPHSFSAETRLGSGAAVVVKQPGGIPGAQGRAPSTCGYSSANGDCTFPVVPGRRFCEQHACPSCYQSKRSVAAVCGVCSSNQDALRRDLAETAIPSGNVHAARKSDASRLVPDGVEPKGVATSAPALPSKLKGGTLPTHVCSYSSANGDCTFPTVSGARFCDKHQCPSCSQPKSSADTNCESCRKLAALEAENAALKIAALEAENAALKSSIMTTEIPDKGRGPASVGYLDISGNMPSRQYFDVEPADEAEARPSGGLKCGYKSGGVCNKKVLSGKRYCSNHYCADCNGQKSSKEDECGKCAERSRRADASALIVAAAPQEYFDIEPDESALSKGPGRGIGIDGDDSAHDYVNQKVVDGPPDRRKTMVQKCDYAGTGTTAKKCHKAAVPGKLMCNQHLCPGCSGPKATKDVYCVDCGLADARRGSVSAGKISKKLVAEAAEDRCPTCRAKMAFCVCHDVGRERKKTSWGVKRCTFASSKGTCKRPATSGAYCSKHADEVTAAAHGRSMKLEGVGAFLEYGDEDL